MWLQYIDLPEKFREYVANAKRATEKRRHWF